MTRTKQTLLVVGMLVAALSTAACGRGNGPTPTPAPAAVEQLPSQEVATPTPAPASDAATSDTPGDSTTGDSTTTETSSEGATTESSSAPLPSSGNAAIDAVASALRNQMANLPMRVTMSAGDTAGGTIEIASPTSMRMNMEGMQMMFVDGRAFMFEDGVWMENPAMAGLVEVMAGQFDLGSIQEQIDTISTAEQLPDETINGEAVSVYQFTVSDDIDGEQGVSWVYIRKSDNLPVRVSTDGEGDEAYSADYTYDSSIVIEAPIP